MQARRNFLSFMTAWFLSIRTKAQTPGHASAKELARHALTGSQAGLEVILVEVTVPPGVPSTAHRHPGIVVGYVLEGEMRFAINGEDEQIVKTGGTFFEPTGALHTTGGSAKPEEPVRFLAFIVAPKGSPVTLPG
jgi:quercetin dioxygenase-like cupin family protein